MNFSKILLGATVAAQLCATSCKKSNDLATEQSLGRTANVSYQLKTINQTTAIAQRVTAGTVQWTAGYASPTLIKFEATKGTTQLEVKSRSTQRLDLFAPVSIGTIAIPNGTFDKVQFKLEVNKNGSNAALQLTGTYGAPGGNIPISFIVNDALEIKTEQSNVTITSSNVNSAITSLDLSKLTFGITQTMLQNAQQVNGSIIISSDVNKSLYAAILNNLDKMHHLDLDHAN